MKQAIFALTFVTSTLLSTLLAFDSAFAQAGFPPPPPKVSPAAGVIDMHVHSHPDVFGRNMDDIDVAQLAKARGMRGIVLKNHVSETASRAALVMKVVPGIEVFGGIVLNKAVGGINPRRGGVDASRLWRTRQGGVAADLRIRQAREDAVQAGCRRACGRAERPGHAGDGSDPEDHRARESRARHRPRASRGDHRGGEARAKNSA